MEKKESYTDILDKMLRERKEQNARIGLEKEYCPSCKKFRSYQTKCKAGLSPTRETKDCKKYDP